MRIIYVYVLLFSTLFTDFFGNRRYPLETSPPTPSGDYPLEKIARSNPHGSIRVMTQPSGSDRFNQEYGLVPVFKFSLEEYYYTPQADTFVEFCLGGNLREDVSRGGGIITKHHRQSSLPMEKAVTRKHRGKMTSFGTSAKLKPALLRANTLHNRLF